MVDAPKEDPLDILRQAFEAGPLRAVREIVDPDLLPDLVGVGFTFGELDVTAIAVADDDTVRLVAGELHLDEGLSAREPAADSVWSRLIGRNLVWGWILTNQQGYEDGLQLELRALDGGAPLQVQLIVVGSRFTITTTHPV